MSVNEWIKSQLVPDVDDYGRPLPSRDRDRQLRTMRAWPESVKHFERWQHYRKAIEAGFYNDGEERAEAYSEPLVLPKAPPAQTAHTHQGVVFNAGQVTSDGGLWRSSWLRQWNIRSSRSV
jgi:hypothetical protein